MLLASIKLADLALLLTVIIGALTILKTLAQGVIFVVKGIRSYRAKNNPPEFPVTLTWESTTEFHPSAGYHELEKFVVLSRVDHPVTIKGFGLDLTFQAQEEWHNYEQAQDSPPVDFPFLLEPYGGLEGYIHAESLGDRVRADGEEQFWTGTEGYVEVVGYGINKLKESTRSY